MKDILALLRRLFTKNEAFYSNITPQQEKKLDELQNVISHRFNNRNLLSAALTHSSFTRAKNGTTCTYEYERMEFFGDAVLGLVTVEYLFTFFPHKSEGYLSKLKSQIVSENYLSIKAKQINLGSYLILGDDEQRSKGYEKKSILADMMESLICAIYLDGGLTQARDFINNFILTGFEDEVASEIHINYKSILQEYSQSKYQAIPTYKTISAEGPDHKKIFSVNVSVNDERVGTGTGSTKKAAEQSAAREACDKLGL